MRGVLQLFHKHSKDLFWNCSRTVLEQTIRTFLEYIWNHSTDVLELFRDIYRMLNGTFYEGCSTIVP